MACLMIVNAQPNGQNLEAMRKYQSEGPAIVAQYGGRMRGGGKPMALEGDVAGSFVVISEWPSREAANAFWTSPEYTALRKFREGTGDYKIMLVDVS